MWDISPGLLVTIRVRKLTQSSSIWMLAPADVGIQSWGRHSDGRHDWFSVLLLESVFRVNNRYVDLSRIVNNEVQILINQTILE